MFRYILIPGAIVMACMSGVFGFFLWAIFHSQFEQSASPDQAYIGDIMAQPLASCYATGCAGVPDDPALACAWRQIISNESSQSLPADRFALHKVCDHLTASDRKWMTSLDADIRLRMRDERRPERNSL
jgi:nitrogen fixation-related uncharacterized protein